MSTQSDSASSVRKPSWWRGVDSARRVAKPRPGRASAVLVGSVVIADQITKTLAEGGHSTPSPPVRNADYAFGLVRGPWLVLCLGAASILLLLVVVDRAASHLRRPWWASPLFLAGGMSNLIDRVVLGDVRDFMPTPWFVFNIADVALLAALLGWYGTVAASLVCEPRRAGTRSSMTMKGGDHHGDRIHPAADRSHPRPPRRRGRRPRGAEDPAVTERGSERPSAPSDPSLPV